MIPEAQASVNLPACDAVQERHMTSLLSGIRDNISTHKHPWGYLSFTQHLYKQSRRSTNERLIILSHGPT